MAGKHTMGAGEIRRAVDDFPLAAAEANDVFHTKLTGSTQDDLAQIWREGEAQTLSILIADDQESGRGRLGRVWYSRPGDSLLVSILLEVPRSLDDNIGWLTLLVAAAARNALEELCTQHVSSDGPHIWISWPNDLVVRTPEPRKIGGILGEYCGWEGDSSAAVVGLGINFSLSADNLPTPSAASLRTANLDIPSRDAFIASLLRGVKSRLHDFIFSGGNAAESGLLAEVNAVCETLRPDVTVGRPHLPPVRGIGEEILADGSLQLRTEQGSVVVTSGEVALLGMPPQIDKREENRR